MKDTPNIQELITIFILTKDYGRLEVRYYILDGIVNLSSVIPTQYDTSLLIRTKWQEGFNLKKLERDMQEAYVKDSEAFNEGSNPIIKKE